MNTWIQIRDLAIASYLPLQPREQSPERAHTTRWHQTTAGSQPHLDVSVGDPGTEVWVHTHFYLHTGVTRVILLNSQECHILHNLKIL